MTFEEWEAAIPEEIYLDSLWQMEVYRLALFAVDLAWGDTTRLMQDRRAASPLSRFHT